MSRTIRRKNLYPHSPKDCDGYRGISPAREYHKSHSDAGFSWGPPKWFKKGYIKRRRRVDKQKLYITLDDTKLEKYRKDYSYNWW